MHFANLLITSFLSLCSLQTALAGHVDLPGRLHKRSAAANVDEPRDLEVASRHELQKRASRQFTYYKTGLGACGGRNVDSDFVVAMNRVQFDSGHWCGKTITITYNGKSTQATVVDRCEACGYGSLDLSPGLFKFFASTAAGVLQGSWIDGAAPLPQPTTTKPKPSPTPTPTTTWSPPPDESTTTTSTTSTTLTTTSATSSTSSVEPSATVGVAPDDGVFSQLNLVMVNLGGLMAFAAKARDDASINVGVN